MTTEQHFGKGKANNTTDLYIGNRIRTRRILLGLSQQNLASAVGVSVQQIQKYEKATNRISSSGLYRLSKFLRTPMSYFFSVMDGPDALTLYEASESLALETIEIEQKEISSLIKYYHNIRDRSLKRHALRIIQILGNESTQTSEANNR